LPLSFVYDGATILTWLFYKKTIEEQVFLLVHKNSLTIDTANSEFAFIYKYLYRGEVDLSTFVQNSISDGGKVQVNIMEGGPSKYLKSRQNTTYEIPCNVSDADCIHVRLKGINFRSKLAFTFFDIAINPTEWGYKALPFIFVSEDGDSLGIYKSDQQFERIGSDTTAVANYVANSSNYFFTSTNATTINLKGTIKLQGTNVAGSFGSNPVRVTVCSILKNDFATNPRLFNSTNLSASTPTTATFDLTISVAENEKLFIVMTGFQYHQ